MLAVFDTVAGPVADLRWPEPARTSATLTISARTRPIRIPTAIGNRFGRRANLAITSSSLSWSCQPSGYLFSRALFEMAWRTSSETNKESSVSGISGVSLSVYELAVRSSSAGVGSPGCHRRCAIGCFRRGISSGMPDRLVRPSLFLTFTSALPRWTDFVHALKGGCRDLKLAFGFEPDHVLELRAHVQYHAAHHCQPLGTVASRDE